MLSALLSQWFRSICWGRQLIQYAHHRVTSSYVIEERKVCYIASPDQIHLLLHNHCCCSISSLLGQTQAPRLVAPKSIFPYTTETTYDAAPPEGVMNSSLCR